MLLYITETDSTGTLLVGSIVLIINFVVLYQIVKSASKGAEIRDRLAIQNRLLTHLARKMGVSEADLHTSFDPDWKTTENNNAV